MQGVKILVIEDEIDLRDAMVSYLNLEEAFAVGVRNLECANKWLQKNQADIIVLDLNLAGEDGLAWLKQTQIPLKTSVVIASARGAVDDRIKGFDLGVDAYLVKPVALEELVAVIENLQLKKQANQQVVVEAEWLLNKLDWSLHHIHSSQLVKLTKLEERIVNCLAQSPGDAVTKNQLISALSKNVDSYDVRSLEVLIRRLREKITPISGDKTRPIKTVHSVGYSFTCQIKVV